MVESIPRAPRATPNIPRRVWQTKAVIERKVIGIMVER
jgi:hypothetical protein